MSDRRFIERENLWRVEHGNFLHGFPHAHAQACRSLLPGKRPASNSITRNNLVLACSCLVRIPDLPPAADEYSMLRELKKISEMNKVTL